MANRAALTSRPAAPRAQDLNALAAAKADQSEVAAAVTRLQGLEQTWGSLDKRLTRAEQAATKTQVSTRVATKL